MNKFYNYSHAISNILFFSNLFQIFVTFSIIWSLKFCNVVIYSVKKPQKYSWLNILLIIIIVLNEMIQNLSGKVLS